LERKEGRGGGKETRRRRGGRRRREEKETVSRLHTRREFSLYIAGTLIYCDIFISFFIVTYKFIA